MKPFVPENNMGSTSEDLSHYEILLLGADATLTDIEASYDRLKQLWYNESRKGDPQAVARLERIELAYAVLSDSNLRRRYDTLLFRSADLHSDNKVAKKDRVLQTVLFLKNRTVWIVLGVVLLLGIGGMLLQSLLSGGHSEYELQLLRQYYPPAPRRLNDSAHSSISDSDSWKAPHRESRVADEDVSLLHNERVTEEKTSLLEKSPLLMPAPDPAVGLLRSTPIHELPQGERAAQTPAGEPSKVERYDEVPLVFHGEPDELLRDRVESFVKTYLDSFEKKDFKALGEHFDVAALEDGSSWNKLQKEYREKFEDVESIRYEMIVRYIARELNGVVTIKGDYHLRYDYKHGMRDSSTGTFEWSLKDMGTQLRLLNARRERTPTSRLGEGR